MSNSKLVSYTRISPNRTRGRAHGIDTVTIHCVVGQCSVETLGGVFAQTATRASSNYGIGRDGRIGLYVSEEDRSWCTSNAANDNRAVTIECASDISHPYAVNDKVYAALLELVTDICRRNGIRRLVWSESKADRIGHRNGCNMTVHRDYANKACPGEYLYSRMGAIAAEVNKRLGQGPEQDQTPVVMVGVRAEQLQLGSEGEIVRALQMLLNGRGFPCTADGIFGKKTLAAVRAFQARKGLTVDGIVGSATWGKLLNG